MDAQEDAACRVPVRVRTTSTTTNAINNNTNSNTNKATIRGTVRGGLEKLAQQELEECWKQQLTVTVPTTKNLGLSFSVTWPRRGNSGSQFLLEIECHKEEVVKEEKSVASDETPLVWLEPVVEKLLTTLKWVDYLHWIIHRTSPLPVNHHKNQDFSNPEVLLPAISSLVETSTLDPTLLGCAQRIGRLAPRLFQGVQVGLEPLPGVLLPTPPMDPSHKTNNASLPTGTGIATSKDSFVVNTVYTQSHVASAVVRSFVSLVQQHADFDATGPNVLWVDAGSGSGALLKHLPEHQRLGVDTHPCSLIGGNKNVLQANFLHMTKESLGRAAAPQSIDHLCVISNPPFSEGSRGDFSAIAKFILQSMSLGAEFLGFIVPTAFVRERIWASLGLLEECCESGKPRLQLLARFVMPPHSFGDAQGSTVHIQSTFLFFRVLPKQEAQTSWGDNADPPPSHAVDTVANPTIPGSFYLVAKRDKSDFPNVSTALLAKAVAQGLEPLLASQHQHAILATPASLAPERLSEFQLSATLTRQPDDPSTSVLEFSLLLNRNYPLSLVHSVSQHVSQHSLGWMSTSVQPGVAQAMFALARSSAMTATTSSTKDVSNPSLAVNIMSGEGTIELEAHMHAASGRPLFMLSGDKSKANLLRTKHRVQELQRTRSQQSTLISSASSSSTNRLPMMDFVLWDAQHLPLRRDVCDLLLADLPFAGSTKKQHQVPTSTSGDAITSTLDYCQVMGQSVRVLVPQGQAVVVSPDSKGLANATGPYHWTCDPEATISKLSMGGIPGQLRVLTKGKACYKDISVWMVEQDVQSDLSSSLHHLAESAIQGYHWNVQNGKLEQNRTMEAVNPQQHLLVAVSLVDTFFHAKSGQWSHCYRFFWDGLLTNVQTKVLDKRVREYLQNHPLEGMKGLRL